VTKTGQSTPDDKPIWSRLVYASYIRIRRHIKIRKDADPFDPRWRPYFLELWVPEEVRHFTLRSCGKTVVKPAPVTRGFGACLSRMKRNFHVRF
jgi:hypothetical protein